jgi:hypothetical protein
MATTKTKQEKKEKFPTEILHLVDSPIAVSRILVKLVDSFPAGIMLNQCIYWQLRTRHPEGWFYKTREEWSHEITLSRGEQERARKMLRERNLLEEDRRGMPSRIWYRINIFELKNQLIDYHNKHEIQYRLLAESESFDLRALSPIDAMELTGFHQLSESAVRHLLEASDQHHATRAELAKILSPLLRVPEKVSRSNSDHALTFSYFKTWKVSDYLLRICKKNYRIDELEDNLLDYESSVKLEVTSIKWNLIWDWIGNPSFENRVLFVKINGIIYAVDAEKEGKAFYQWVENLSKV